MPAQAQVLVVVENGAPEPRVRAWTARVEPDRATTLAEWASEREPVASIEPARLAVLEQIEALLVEGRANATRLEERAALATLARAEELAEHHFDLPGMSAWYAEIQLAIAVTAAQAEMGALAEAALTRAASVDPSRAVQTGEARPELVERSREAVRAVAVGPRGRFEVRANVPGARAFLDDRPLGRLPRVVDASRGPHVLRIEAPGHRAWADVLEVLEGERAPIVVDLSPTSLRAQVAALERAAREGDLSLVERTLGAIADPPALSILFAGAGPQDRALLARCDPSCTTERLEGGAREAGAGLREDLAWLGAPRAVAPPVPWWEEWYVWVAAGAVAAAAVALVAALAQPQGEGPLRVEIDASGLVIPGVD